MDSKNIFSGNYSEAMWREINEAKSIDALRTALYFVCCRLQEFESEVRGGCVAKTQSGHLEQLMLLSQGVTWDGNLISKYARDDLVSAGLAERANGWNLITTKGVQYLIDLGYLRP